MSELRVDGDSVIAIVALGIDVAVKHAVIDRVEVELTPDVTLTVCDTVNDCEM